MLVLSRDPGASIVIQTAEDTSLVTLLSITTDRATILANTSKASRPGKLRIHTHSLEAKSSFALSPTITITLMDLREGSARIGIYVPRDVLVHRLEVFQQLHRDEPDDDDSGGTGSPCVNPPPRPPNVKFGESAPGDVN